MAGWSSPWALCGGWGSFWRSLTLFVLCPMSVGFLAALRVSSPSGVSRPWPGRGEAEAGPPAAFLLFRVAVPVGVVWDNNMQDPGWLLGVSWAHRVPQCPHPRHPVPPNTGQAAVGTHASGWRGPARPRALLLIVFITNGSGAGPCSPRWSVFLFVTHSFNF